MAEAEEGVEVSEATELSSNSTSSLSNICLQLAALGHDRARELAEKERDASKAKKPVRFALMNLLSQLAVLEKQYFNLAFLSGQKSIFRKENSLKVSYSNLQGDFLRLSQDTRTPAKSHHSRWLPSKQSSEEDEVPPQQTSAELSTFVAARLDMMEIYEKASSFGAQASEVTATSVKQLEDPNAPDGGLKTMIGSMMMPYTKLINLLDKWRRDHYEALSKLQLGKFGDSFLWEYEILAGLVNALKLLNYWRFFDTLIELSNVSSSQRQWDECQQKRQQASSNRSLFDSFWIRSAQPADAESTGCPALYQWFKEMKGLVLGKFSLYFFQVLSSQTSLPLATRRAFDAKTPVNYIKQIEEFQRECDAPIVTLIYNATEDPDYTGPGFQLPGKIVAPVTEHDLFPAVFTSSMSRAEADQFDDDVPKAVKRYHWINILKGMEDEVWELALPQTVVHFYDQQIKYTYFLTRVDPEMTLVVIYETKRRDLDPKVKSFMLDFASQLRGCKSFAGLKPRHRG